MESTSLRIKILFSALALIIIICPWLGGGLTEGFVYEVILILAGLGVFLFSMVLVLEKRKILIEKKPWPLIFLSVFILGGIFSCFFSIRSYNSWSEFIIWLAAISIFLIFSQLAAENIIKKFSWLLIIMGCLVSLAGFVLFIVSRSEADIRLDSVLYNPNSLAGYLICLLPIAIILLFSEQSKAIKLLIWLANIILAASFLLTVSYTGWLCFLPILLFIIIYFRKHIFKKRFIFSSIIALSLVFLIVFSLRYCHSASVDEGIKIYKTISSHHATDSSSQRFYFLRVGWEIFLHHPFVGIGMNNMKLAYLQIQNNVIETPRSLHNNFLDLLVATGIFGMLGFLGFVFTLFFKTVKIKNLYILGLMLGFLGLLLHSALDFAWQIKIVVVNFFVISGLLYGYYLKTKKNIVETRHGVSLLVPFLIIISLFFLGRGLQIFYSNNNKTHGERY